MREGVNCLLYGIKSVLKTLTVSILSNLCLIWSIQILMNRAYHRDLDSGRKELIRFSSSCLCFLAQNFDYRYTRVYISCIMTEWSKDESMSLSEFENASSLLVG